jgi:hypothetical protein
MSGYEDSVPAYLTVRMTPQEGPLAAFADQEAWLARERYPELHGVGMAEYLWARELDSGGWELSEHGGSWPQQARDALGSHFRRRAQAAQGAQGGADPGAAERWARAARRMDREAVDEVVVLGERFRVVRVGHFIRSGPAGPEPPRPSDPDPAEVGEGYRVPSRTKGFVVDPFTGTGLSEGILKLDLLPLVPVVKGGPEAMNEDSRAAVHRYPGGVLLPAAFLVARRADGRWQFHQPGATHSSPQGARDALAYWLRVTAPFTRRMDADAERRALYTAAADRLDDKRADTVSVDGLRFRVTRVERLVRLGPDGPEPPRPSDYDPEVPVEVQARQLREQGLVDEDGNDVGPRPEPPRMAEWKRLFDQEEARRTAVRRRRTP